MAHSRLWGFGAVSGLGWTLDFLVFTLLVQTGADPAAANAVGASLAVTWVYFASVRRIFRYGGDSRRSRFAAYAVYQVVGITAASAAVSGIVLLTAAHPLFAKLAVTPVTFLANYLFMSWLTSGGDRRTDTPKMDRPRVLVFVPMYQCERHITRVLERIRNHLATHVHEVLVVDNGSSDGSCAAASAALAGVGIPGTLLQNDCNVSLGGSHKVAFAYALAGRFDWVVVVHGDDQADPADLAPLIAAGALHEGVDALLGSRFSRGSRRIGYAWHRTWGNIVFNTIFSVVSGTPISDLGSGLNAFRVAWLRSTSWMHLADGLTFNVHLLLLLIHRRAAFRFFPISWRDDGQVSNVRLLRQAWITVGIAWGYAWWRGSYLARPHSGHGINSYGSSVHSENWLKRAAL
jgi:glycosyltransferase involved in cell wall biosynthesis/uncharacterized membrane protein